jgi:hypothetical protein
MRGFILAAALCLSACTRVEHVGPDMLAISCRKEMMRCYKRASRECPHGFDVIATERNGQVHVTRVYDTYVAGPVGGGEVLIRCLPPTHRRSNTEADLDEETAAARKSLRERPLQR